MRAVDRAAFAELTPASETSPKNPSPSTPSGSRIPSQGWSCSPLTRGVCRNQGKLGEEAPSPGKRSWVAPGETERKYEQVNVLVLGMSGLQNLHTSTLWALLSLPQHHCILGITHQSEGPGYPGKWVLPLLQVYMANGCRWGR